MKKNKILTTALMVSALTIGSLVPASANDNIATAGNKASTKVNIQVVNDPKLAATLSVEVPTVLALTVVADKDATDKNQSPYVVLPGAEAGTAGQNEGALMFKNRSMSATNQLVPAYINSVNIVNGAENTGWHVVAEDVSPTSQAKKLNMFIANQKLTGQGSMGSNSSETIFPSSILLPGLSDESNAGESQESIMFKVLAGGKISDYEGEKEAHAFTLEWSISLEPQKSTIIDGTGQTPQNNGGGTQGGGTQGGGTQGGGSGN